jgi:hypothetical protein
MHQAITSWKLVHLALVLPLGLALAGSGCSKDPAEEARELKSCRGSGNCVEGNICVKPEGGKSGVCVKPCKGPGTCFEGFRCTGNYVETLAGHKVGFKSHPFCQKPAVPVGDKCEEVGRGCQEGAGCFQGTCVKICSKDGKCEAKQRCEPIVVKEDRRALPWMVKAAYKGCVPATIPHGGKCDPAKVPMCEPGNECIGGKCAGVCAKNDECPEGKKCHPYVARVRKPLYKTALETLFHACQPASLEDGAACKKNQWPLCKRGHRCYYEKCAKLCETTADCGTTGKCVRVTQSYGILKDKKKTLYKACVPAIIPEGDKCGKGISDRCLQKHRCLKEKCVRTCQKHEECTEGRACSGEGWYKNHDHKARMAAVTGDKANYHFCQPGDRTFVPRATYNRCKSDRSCLPEHKCHRGRCRPFCKKDVNCPTHLSVKVPCKELQSKTDKKKWKVCLGLF